MGGIKGLLGELIGRTEEFGVLSSIGLVVLFVTMIGIMIWTFRPSSREAYKKMSRITVD